MKTLLRKRERVSYCLYESHGGGWDESSTNTDKNACSLMSFGQEIIMKTEMHLLPEIYFISLPGYNKIAC